MDESEKAPRIEVQNIDHLGIVAGIIEDAGLDVCCQVHAHNSLILP
jgi:hypothetical protein